MNLNDLERKFFEQILRADLAVPVQASLEHNDGKFDAIVVPEITAEGDFMLRYYNALHLEPQTTVNQNRKRTNRMSIKHAFGLHPLLERAWLNSDLVKLQMRPTLLPINPERSPKIDAKVFTAQAGNKGSLRLQKNQATVRRSLLNKAEFSILGFPEFESNTRRQMSVAGIDSSELEKFRSVASHLGEGAKASIQPSAHHVVLDSGDGWNVRFTRNDEHTRGVACHTGVIERTDGSNFGVDDLDNILQLLKYFLAFVSGYYCNPTVVVGYDTKNRPAWGEIGRFVHEVPTTLNWFNYSKPERNGDYLESLFPKFSQKWKTNREEFIAIIECYLHSNVMTQAGVPQDAVAKSYTGLEILASLVLQKKIIQNSGKEIHDMLSKHKIPHRDLDKNEIPILSALGKRIGQAELRGSCLLSRVRNYVIHPLRAKMPIKVKPNYVNYLDTDPIQYSYLHDLSQFYLEYMLLKFCGYKVNGYRRLLESLQRV